MIFKSQGILYTAAHVAKVTQHCNFGNGHWYTMIKFELVNGKDYQVWSGTPVADEATARAEVARIMLLIERKLGPTIDLE
jgi:hypothetical protein